MSFIEGVIAKAQACVKTVLLPEPEDERTLRAADIILDRGIAKVILIGDADTVQGKAKELGLTRDFEIVDPGKAAHLDDFAQEFHEMRKAKGLTEEAALDTMREPIPHGIMMLHKGRGDGLVAGAIHSTGDTLRPALQILRTAPGCALVSSFFVMVFGDTPYVFADSGLVEEPNVDQLAEIAVASAESAMGFGIPPVVAMLSYSTKGSATSSLTEKVIQATALAQQRAKDRFGPDQGVIIDGELQLDAAIVPKVCASKAPGSPVAGNARVLIFPNLDSGNIAYKLGQRLGGAEAYGPLIQGIRMPVNDLSRGCSADDIVGVAAVTSVQSQMRDDANG